MKPPGGGAPPPTHSWRICDRGLVLAGVLGVLGNLGILGKNLENIAPERSQIEPRGLKNRAPGPPKSSPEPSKTPFSKNIYLKNGRLELQAGIAQLWLQVRNQFLHFSRQEAPNLEKMAPEPSRIEARGLQNQAWSHPRRYFSKTFNLRG